MDTPTLLQIIEAIPVGVILAHKDGKINYANKAALKCLKINIKSIHGVDIMSLFPSLPGKRETIIRIRDNQKIPVRVTTLQLPSGEKAIIITDITEIHQLQKEILKMDRLASLGELTSGIAHEIRNPLAGIKTTAQALNEDIGEYDHRKTYVSRIIMEIDRLNQLLLNFFDFARPRALKIRSCNAQKIIEDSVYMVKEKAKENHIQIIEFYPPHKVELKADPDMIQQVLINIFINAIQAMGSRGKVEVQLIDKVESIEITVNDSGKGIPENIRNRIFEPFFTTKAKGVGLGLSISYRIIKMHAGNISFDTSPSGTTFKIGLPKE
ncbi:MAG: PAS domain-containing protein [Deltaproteobacteria bacterium]|nr:PAS domain-containing protein [Deltaproteobacteria bacterium]